MPQAMKRPEVLGKVGSILYTVNLALDIRPLFSLMSGEDIRAPRLGVVFQEVPLINWF